MRRVHIIGAGLAGLSAALRLSEAQLEIHIYEGARHAGGRCRSFRDDTLGRIVDNGNHLLLSGNDAAMDYLRKTGARETLTGPKQARFPFFDLETGEQWDIRPNPSRLPWWIFSRARRAPQTHWYDYARALRLRTAGSATVDEIFRPGSAAFRRFWEPLSLAVLNAPPDQAAAALLWPVLVETLGGGESACRPRIARDGLSQSFVDPAVRHLKRRGVKFHFGRRVRALSTERDKVTGFRVGAEEVRRFERDIVILAVPPWAAAGLVPRVVCPEGSYPIAGAHFRLDEPVSLPGGQAFLGLVGGTAQWLFLRGDVASITISAAADWNDQPGEALAQATWRDVARVLGADPGKLPPYRVIRERRATFAQTPSQIARRPRSRTPYRNLFLAGDWIDTGLPATIEGAVRSGRRAARHVLTHLG